MEIKRIGKYLEFTRIPNPGKKTQVWEVYNFITSDYLGMIYWRTGWRQYVMEMDYIDMNSQCLKDVATFIDQLMEARK